MRLRMNSSFPPNQHRLDLSRMAQHSIIAARDIATGQRRHTSFDVVRDDMLEHGSFLRAIRRRQGYSKTRIGRALPYLLAPGFCINLSSRIFRCRRPGFNPGFFCDAA